MDGTAILLAVLTASLGALISWARFAKKDNSDIQSQITASAASTVETMQSLIEELKAKIDDMEVEISELKKQNDELLAENLKLMNLVTDLMGKVSNGS